MTQVLIKKGALQKGIILFVVLLFSFVAEAKTKTKNMVATQIPEIILEKIHSNKLYNAPQWQRLLHYKNGKSEIDDPKFFFSAEGKFNLEAELKASIEKLINDKSDDEKSTLCYYPSRSYWILNQLPELEKIITAPNCKGLKKELAALDAKRATLILASAHINSPASAFGHTFLRLDASEDTPLVSYAVNYAAQTKETNGIIYAYQGLFGGYGGRYSIEPYSKKIKTYSDLEQRDIWEYPLDLTQAELDKLILHIFEIRHFYADYYFTSENCSYNLLWLIDIAKEGVATNSGELVKQFKYKAIPIDTLRAVADAGLVKESVYRPSKRKKMLQKIKAIKNSPKAIRFAKSHDYDLNALTGLSKKQKANALELATLLLQTDHSDAKIAKKEYLGHFLTLLNARSELGDIESSDIKQPFAPVKSHLSTKMSLSYGSDDDAILRMKVAYHDIYDNESGYVPGAYINFFDTAFKYKDNELKLDEINLLDIRSYAIQDPIFKPISWQVALGGKRNLDDSLDPYFQVGAGVTLGNETLFSYATVTPAFYIRNESQQSISANVGLIYNPSSSLKTGLLGKKEWLTDDNELLEIEPFITYSVSKTTALNLRYRHTEMNDDVKDEAILSLFWYF